MKTSVIEIRDMLSVLGVLGVEKRIGKVHGVESVTVNFAAGNATVRYDETRLKLSDIKVLIHQSMSESEEAESKSENKNEKANVVNQSEADGIKNKINHKSKKIG